MLLYGAFLYGLVATGRFPDSKVVDGWEIQMH